MTSPADLMSPERVLPMQGPSPMRKSSFRSTLPAVCTIDPSQWDPDLVRACSSVWGSRVQWAQAEHVRIKPHKVTEYVLYVDMAKLTEEERRNQKMVLPFGVAGFEINLQEAIQEYPALCVSALDKKLQEALELDYLRNLCLDGIVAVYTKTHELYHSIDSERTEIETPDDFCRFAKRNPSLDVLLRRSRECYTKIERAIPDSEIESVQQLRERVHKLASSDRVKEECVRLLLQIYDKVHSRYEVFRATVAHREKSEQIPQVEILLDALQQERSLDKSVEKILAIMEKMKEEMEAWQSRRL